MRAPIKVPLDSCMDCLNSVGDQWRVLANPTTGENMDDRIAIYNHFIKIAKIKDILRPLLIQ